MAATGTVRVTAVSPFVRAYLATGLALSHAEHPSVVVDIECSESVVDLVAGRFDVGVRVGPMQDAGFVARPLGPLALVLCASPVFLARGRGWPSCRSCRCCPRFVGASGWCCTPSWRRAGVQVERDHHRRQAPRGTLRDPGQTDEVDQSARRQRRTVGVEHRPR